MILYYFPPLGGIGTLRSLRYVKHLPALGWKPYVLSVRESTRLGVIDETLVRKVPSDVELFRTNFLDIKRPFQIFSYLPFSKLSWYLSQAYSFLPPDRFIGWIPFSYNRAIRIIAKNNIDAIYTLSSPYSSHLIGLLLKKKLKVPWVADFGDEWTWNPFNKTFYGLPRYVDKKLERKVLNKSDHIIVAWPDMASLFSTDISNKVTTITCCYEEEDFNKTICNNDRKKFRITYTGSFYASQQPTHFLLAVKSILDEGKIPIDRFELLFIGQTRIDGFKDFEGTILDKIIRRVGFVSHGESIRYLMDTDVLLLIVSKERGVANIPGKTFEYIATGNPILALIPTDGAASKLLNKTKTGVIVDPEDIENIKNKILELYKKWKENKLNIESNWEEIYKYEAKEGAKSLARVFEEVLFNLDNS